MDLDATLANLEIASAPLPIPSSATVEQKVSAAIGKSLSALAEKIDTLVDAGVKRFILVEGDLYNGNVRWKPEDGRDHYRIDSIELMQNTPTANQPLIRGAQTW